MNFVKLVGLAVAAAFVVPAVAGAAEPPAAWKKPGSCITCHKAEAGKHLVGPSLFGIIGRKAGTADGFKNYSDDMKNLGITWDEAQLRKYLPDPKAMVPHTKMVFPGLKDPKDVEEVIAYLKTLK